MKNSGPCGVSSLNSNYNLHVVYTSLSKYMVLGKEKRDKFIFEIENSN